MDAVRARPTETRGRNLTCPVFYGATTQDKSTQTTYREERNSDIVAVSGQLPHHVKYCHNKQATLWGNVDGQAERCLSPTPKCLSLIAHCVRVCTIILSHLLMRSIYPYSLKMSPMYGVISLQQNHLKHDVWQKDKKDNHRQPTAPLEALWSFIQTSAWGAETWTQTVSVSLHRQVTTGST